MTKLRESKSWLKLLNKGRDPLLKKVNNSEDISNTFQAPAFQRPGMVLLPTLTALPWHDSSKFEWVQRLDDNYKTIRDECNNLFTSDKINERIFSNVHEGEWHTFYFYNQGRRNDENCKQ